MLYPIELGGLSSKERSREVEKPRYREVEIPRSRDTESHSRVNLLHRGHLAEGKDAHLAWTSYLIQK